MTVKYRVAVTGQVHGFVSYFIIREVCMGFLNEKLFIFKCRVGLRYNKDNEDSFCIWLFDDNGDPLSGVATAGAIAPTLEQVIDITGRNLLYVMSEKLTRQE